MADELTGRPRKKGSVDKMNWKSIAEYATQITMSDKNTEVLARDAVAKKLVPMMVVGGALGLLAAAVMIGAAIAAMGASPFSPRIERMQTSAGWAVFALGAVTTWGLGVVGARMGCDVLRDPTNPDQAGQLDKPPWKIDALGRIPDFPVTRSHPPASWPSAANSSICRTYRKTAGEESRRRSPVANRWMRP